MISREACCAAFAVVGCYSPSYVDCEVTCGNDLACPSGLMCDTRANACRSPGSQACGVDADSGVTDSDAACSSWVGVSPPSNFDPCDPSFPPAGSALNIDQVTKLDTTNGSLEIGSDTMTVGVDYHGMWLIHVPAITIDYGVTVTGTLPLLLVADTTITVGNVTVTATTDAGDSGCVAPNAGETDQGGDGGGGGGYGSNGEEGGMADSGSNEPGEASNGSVSLIPLRFGCGGGSGGSPDVSVPAGAGGAAGAALQLAAGLSITITDGGMLTASGGGGGGGQSNDEYSAGGGGGGTGGSILLEAPVLTIDGAVCAPGGGGGEGGGGIYTGSPGIPYSCDGGQGGDDGVAGGDGGNGGGSGSASGSPGFDNYSGGGGGGGGGSVGRIHFHATSAVMMGSGAQVVPAQH